MTFVSKLLAAIPHTRSGLVVCEQDIKTLEAFIGDNKIPNSMVFRFDKTRVGIPNPGHHFEKEPSIFLGYDSWADLTETKKLILFAEEMWAALHSTKMDDIAAAFKEFEHIFISHQEEVCTIYLMVNNNSDAIYAKAFRAEDALVALGHKPFICTVRLMGERTPEQAAPVGAIRINKPTKALSNGTDR